jgi:hypothetical protein
MEEVVYDPTVNNSPENFIHHKAAELWSYADASSRFARQYVERAFGVAKGDTAAYRKAIQAGKIVLGSEVTHRQVRDIYADREIRYQAVMGMVNKIKTEVNVTRSMSLNSPNIGESVKKVNELKRRRECYVIELDIETHKDEFPNPF